jgi:hypothetical protein
MIQRGLFNFVSDGVHNGHATSSIVAQDLAERVTLPRKEILVDPCAMQEIRAFGHALAANEFLRLIVRCACHNFNYRLLVHIISTVVGYRLAG